MSAGEAEVHLDKEYDVFSCGEYVKGCVYLETPKMRRINAVELVVYGGSRVLQHQDRASTSRDPLTEEELYMRDTYLLWGRYKGPTLELESGQHFFPFEFQLPSDVPCSFESADGWVRYYLQARVIVPTTGGETVVRKPFTVLRDYIIDNNESQGLYGEEKENVPRVMCCHPGKITCSLHVSRTSYLPGQVIKAKVEVQNKSTMRIRNISVLLNQVARYSPSECPSYTTRITLAQSATITLPSGHRGITCVLPLLVPPVPPTGLDGCSLIDVKYMLVLSLPMRPAPVEVSVPVVIGNAHGKGRMKSDSPVSYIEQDFPRTDMPASSLLPISPSSLSLANRLEYNATYRPKYRVFNKQNCPIPIISLSESPRLTRKPLEPLGIETIHLGDEIMKTESVV